MAKRTKPIKLTIGDRTIRAYIVQKRPLINKRECDAICDFVKRELRFHKGIKADDRLEVILHELFHWQNPDWTERQVELTAKQWAYAVDRITEALEE